MRVGFSIFFAVALSAHGATFQSDGTPGNIQALHNAAACHDGDTITLPANHIYTWATGLVLTKSITLQGGTTIVGDHTTFHTTPPTITNETVLIDNMPGSNRRFIDWNPTSAGLCRVTGLSFTGLNPSQPQAQNGFITFGSNNAGARFRKDHLHAHDLNFLQSICPFGNGFGVEDHCVFDGLNTQTQLQHSIKNGTGPYGDLEWSQPMPYGTDKYWFIEDCYIKNLSGLNTASGGVDCEWGGKYVVRYCELFDAEILIHGTDTSGRKRGGRGCEIYNCNYNFIESGWALDGNRSGNQIVHDNTVYSPTKPGGFGLATFRMSSKFSPWGGATGKNTWDVNDPVLYFSGTVASYSHGSVQILTVGGSPGWTINQWAGYSMSGNTTGSVILISSNTNNTVTGTDLGFGQTFNVGETVEIRKVLVALDQPCRGQGDLLSGDTPPPTNLHQVREPSYSWNNKWTGDGSTINFREATAGNAQLVQGVDYFNDTVKPGYVAFTYPHPLVSGASPTPSPSSTAIPTVSPTPSGTPSLTPTPTPDSSPTAAPSPTPTPSIAPSPTASPSPLPSSPTPTATAIQTPTPTATPTNTPTPIPTGTPTPTATATPNPFVLWGWGERVRSDRFAYLSWSGSTVPAIDIFRDGTKVATVFGASEFTDSLGHGGSQTFVYTVCEQGTTNCSNEIFISF
jgi:hypothetical protein